MSNVAALREALDVSPDNVPLRLLLARTLLSEGDPESAKEVYRDLAHVEPTVLDLALGRAARLVSLPPVEPEFPMEPRPAAGVPSAAKEPAADPRSRRPTPSARPALRFADVGGLESLKERLRMDIVYPLARPDLFRAYGKKVGGGVLLYGPPGCGKTHLAKAAAGESGASFFIVEIQAVLEMWLGESEKRLHDLFEEARTNAPAILFFDEVEAIGGARHQIRHGPGRRVVNQLLSEMDGAHGNNEGVLFVGATNAPWDVDPALRRPGRFNRVVFVAPPDVAARSAILALGLRDRPHEKVDLDAIASRTARFSGADLANLVDVASERALADALRTGKIRPITHSDFVACLDRVRPTTAEWLTTAKRYVSYANQAGLYDDVEAWLGKEE